MLCKEGKEKGKEKGFSRRDVIIGASKAVVSTAILSVGGLTLVSGSSLAKGKHKYPWPYKKLDPEEASKIAYENWYKHYCSYAVVSGIFIPLQQKIGDPYSYLPIEAFKFGHGGVIGWGTLCGTLFGAGIVSSFVAGDEGEEILNDVMAWYTNTELPIYTPKSPKLSKIPVKSKSNSPLCHVSVGKWMKKANYKFFSPERKDRCARLAADVTKKTVILLNKWVDDKYAPVHGSQAKMHQMPAQNNCMNCHGKNIPKVPGTGK